MPYELAKKSDSEFAREIVAIVEAEDYATVRVTFELNGGHWTDEVVPFVVASGVPSATLTVTALNDQSAKKLTLLDKRVSLFQYYYKLFIKGTGAGNAYRIVGINPATKDIIRSQVDDYDFILAVHELCEDTVAFETVRDLATEDAIGTVVVFDDNLSNYAGGQLSCSFYPLQPDEDLEMEFLEEVALPGAERDGYHFSGWSDGEEIYTVFPRYPEAEGITAVTYTAVWELYSIEEFTAYMNELLPKTIYGDLELPDAYSGYAVTGKQPSDIMSPEGKYHQPLSATFITLTATLKTTGIEESVSFTLKAEAYKSLASPIASTYIYRNYHLVTDAFFDTLDIINCAFLTASADGSLYGSSVLNNITTYIMPKARERGCWVLFSVAPDSAWTAMASNPTARANFADNIVKIINEYGFDGVDIDWEGSVNGTYFTLMMEEVYTKVKANNPRHLVTAAIAGGQWQPPYYNLKNSSQYIDYINMMTYSMVSNNGYYQNNLYPRSTFHNPTYGVGKSLASCSVQESIAIFRGYQVPVSKIIVGVAFYGVKQVKQDGAWKSSGSVFYTSIASSYLNNPAYTAYFDEVAGVPYILKNDGTEFISYDDARSIQMKCDYIYTEGLAGMMYWENGCDTTGTLLQAMRIGLHK